jgi:hypothetical protein
VIEKIIEGNISKKNNRRKCIGKKKHAAKRLKYPVWFGFIFKKHQKPNQTEPIKSSLVQTLTSPKIDTNWSN